MRAAGRRLALALGFLGSACAGFNVGSADGCAAACATALACGFLPSGLGFGVDSDAALADCERRCEKSPRDVGDITQILSCLDGSWDATKEVQAWCRDEASELAGDLTCATASTCLGAEFPGGRLQGDVHIEVSLISLADFTTSFGADALVDLYVPKGLPVSSCAQALCGPDSCIADGDSGLDALCDSTLCGRERVKTGTICSELGANVLELGVDSRYTPRITQVLLDDNETEKECKEVSRTFTAEEFDTQPGPSEAFARVVGRLPAAELARIGVSAVDDDDGQAQYCLRFPGMRATLRAGQNLVLVPIGTVDQLVEAGVAPASCSL